MTDSRDSGSPAGVPSHLAVIMDGNGRWATKRARPRWMGHVRGAHTAREVVGHALRRGVEHLTLYAFSSDNFKRPAEEVGFLFDLFTSHLERQLGTLIEHGIRLSIIGRRDRLPRVLRDAIVVAEERTKGGDRMHLRVAIDYSGRAAIERAFTRPAADADAPAPTGEEHLLPAVDLLLRTGGERRLSDFLLWECAYAELAFLDVNFPDLSTSDIDAAFADYAKRERRFGAVPAEAAKTSQATATSTAVAATG
jgi:undecaprenyl diphosphate synthase